MTKNSEDDGFLFELDRKSGVPRKKVKYTEQYAIDEIKRFAAAHPKKQLTGTNYELWSGRDGNRHSLSKVLVVGRSLCRQLKYPMIVIPTKL